MSVPIVDALISLVGSNAVLTRAEDVVPYGFDGTAALNERPSVVVFPQTTEQVVRCIQLAGAHNTPIVTRGSGTGLSGGSVPTPGCVVLWLTQMDAILAVDPRNLTLRAQPGVITQRIDDAAARHGLFYPPDPGSLRISTIGGNVAENSGGLRGLKYGVTRDYVMGLEVVLADGRIARLGNACVKDVAGYSLKDLFIGSEGTLGVITEVLLKLVPRPAARRTMLALYDRIEDAAETVSAIIAARIIPCTLEFLDRVTAGCVEDYARVGLPTDCAAVLLMETDGHPAAVADEATQMESIARAHGARDVRTARDDAEALQLAGARRNAFAALARRRPTTILEDVTVPRSELASMVTFVAETAAAHDTVDVLLANGCVVDTPPTQPCCGSLHAHNGLLDRARDQARRLIDLIPPDRYDAIITNAGGCGSHLRQYGHLLEDDPQYRDAARARDAKLRDVHEWLIEIGSRAPGAMPFDRAISVTYHDSCHLVHGQKVSAQPRALLRQVPGVTVVELTESTWCCGAAGVYSVTQPDQAEALLRRKVGHIDATGTQLVAAANPGCHLQIARGLRDAGVRIEVAHPISLLASAYRREGIGKSNDLPVKLVQ